MGEGSPADGIAAYLPHCPSPRLKAALEGMYTMMDLDGKTFTDALAAYPTIFEPTSVARIRAAGVSQRAIPTVNAIIEEESGKRRLSTGTFVDRLDAYAAYIGTFISLAVVAKLILPQTLQQMQQDHVASSWPVAGLQALGFAGGLLLNPFFYVALILVLVLTRWIVVSTGNSQQTLAMLEAIKWRLLPFTKDIDLTADRLRAMKVIADASFAGLPEDVMFGHALDVTKSPAFTEGLRKQETGVLSGRKTIEETIATNPLWGLEVTTYFAASGGGGWHEDVQDMLRTLTEDEVQNRRIRAYSGTAVHSLVALAVTAVITLIVTIAQFAVLIGSARAAG